MMTCGVDIGSTTIEAVLWNGTKVIASRIAQAGASPAERAQGMFRQVLTDARVDQSDLSHIVATGFGRNYFPHAHTVVSEILCHAAGVAHVFPRVHTIIEVGGQDSKMIRTGENGSVVDFAMNDRCAAGTGKFIETVARTLSMTVEETGPAALQTGGDCEISSMCAVFAETEIVGLLHQGIPREVILRGVFRSVARRITGMAGRLGMQDDVVFTGGVANNAGMVEALRQVTGRQIHVPDLPAFTGALGAALLAARNGAILTMKRSHEHQET